MENRKYTAKEIIKKALSMADLSNTSFMSHEELTEALNDSWKELTQVIINNGDKIFVRERFLAVNGSAEYTIPEDCYQILSLKDAYTGNIINRYVESMGINSNTYEIVNNKLRLYGVNASNLLLTYWVVPKYITFPDKERFISLPTLDVIDTCRNGALIKDGDKLIVYNTNIEETIGTFSYMEDVHYVLGNGHVVIYTEDFITYNDYYGNEIFSREVGINSIVKDYNGFIYYTVGDELYLMNTKQKQSGDGIKALLKDYDIYDSGIYTKDGILIDETTIDNIQYVGEDYVIYMTDEGLIRFNVNELSTSDIDVFALMYLGTVTDGALTSNGTDVSVQSTIEDTILNFPNNLYFTMLAASVAKKILQKQNAENNGVNEVYEMAYKQYVDSLDMNGLYSRIINVR